MTYNFEVHQTTKNICTSLALTAFIDASAGIATKTWDRLSLGVVFGVFSIGIALSLALESKIETSHLHGRITLVYTRLERAATIDRLFGLVIIGATAMGILDMVQGLRSHSADQSFLGIGLIGVSYASVLHFYLKYGSNRSLLIVSPASESTSITHPPARAVILQVNEALAPHLPV